MIQTHHLGKTIDQQTILQDITLTIHPGEPLCIVGKSGSGKTLLLRLLTGQEKPTHGTIQVDGVPLHSLPPSILRLYHERMGYVAQDVLLPQSDTVSEIVALPLILQNMPPAETAKRVATTLSSLGLLSHANTLARHLPGGIQKLVSIARAVVTSPLLLFADEPLDGLDVLQATHVCTLLKNMNTKGTTLIIASRDPVLADKLQCRMLKLTDGTVHSDPSSVTLSSISPPKTPERSVKITAVK